MAAKYDWASVDWTLSTTEIATKLGTALAVVSRARRRFAPETEVKNKWQQYDWASVDWSQPNMKIAKNLGCSPYTVLHVRQKYAPEIEVKNKWQQYDWASVDWTLSTTEIAKKVGATYEAVPHARRRFAPETLRKKYNWTTVDWTKKDVEIEKEIGASLDAIRKARNKFCPTIKKSMVLLVCPMCKKKFKGSPYEKYCTTCRAKKKKESQYAYLLQRKQGTLRETGTLDHCELCGIEYIVKSGHQKYCPACGAIPIYKRKKMLEIKGKHYKKQSPPPISLCDAEKLGWDALGRVPDSALAKIVGVSHTTVRKRREKSGISPCVSKKTRVDWAKFDDLLLSSNASAHQLAKRIGCDVSTVRERRRFLQGEKCKYSKEQ